MVYFYWAKVIENFHIYGPISNPNFTESCYHFHALCWWKCGPSAGVSVPQDAATSPGTSNNHWVKELCEAELNKINREHL